MRTFSWRLNERIIVCSVPRNDGAEGSFGRMKMESVHPGHWEERTRDEVLVPVDETASAGTTTSASNGRSVG